MNGSVNIGLNLIVGVDGAGFEDMWQKGKGAMGGEGGGRLAIHTRL